MSDDDSRQQRTDYELTMAALSETRSPEHLPTAEWQRRRLVGGR